MLSQTPRSTTSSGFARRLMRAGLIAKSRGVAYVEAYRLGSKSATSGRTGSIAFPCDSNQCEDSESETVNAIGLARTI
jgi:hypothetical protein